MNQKLQKDDLTQNVCGICAAEFTLNKNIPFIVCPFSHTLCLACLKKLRSPFKCPYCRQEIQPKKIMLGTKIVQSFCAQKQIIYQLGQLRFKRNRGRIVIDATSGEPEMEQNGEFMMKILEKMVSYVIPLIYALQIFSFAGEIALQFSNDECLGKQIADDSLTLRKYVIMDLGATGIFAILVFLAYLASQIQGSYFQGFRENILPVIPKLFFSAKFVIDCVIWLHIIYVLQFKCRWMIEDFQIAQLVIRCGIAVFIVVLVIHARVTTF